MSNSDSYSSGDGFSPDDAPTIVEGPGLFTSLDLDVYQCRCRCHSFTFRCLLGRYQTDYVRCGFVELCLLGCAWHVSFVCEISIARICCQVVLGIDQWLVSTG
jgi:hypothetical protein